MNSKSFLENLNVLQMSQRFKINLRTNKVFRRLVTWKHLRETVLGKGLNDVIN